MVNNIVLPAEWHRQSFVQLTYPHKNTDWAYMLDEVSACFDEIITTIAKYENVVVVCADEESVSQVSYLISHIAYRKSLFPAMTLGRATTPELRFLKTENL